MRYFQAVKFDVKLNLLVISFPPRPPAPIPSFIKLVEKL